MDVTDSLSADTDEKRVGWAELFVDLVFVFAVTEVSALIEDDHSWTGMLRALVVFVPLYWTWLGAAAVVVVLLPLAPFLPAIVALLVLAVVVAGLNVVEMRINAREGWRARTAGAERPGRAGGAVLPVDGGWTAPEENDQPGFGGWSTSWAR